MRIEPSFRTSLITVLTLGVTALAARDVEPEVSVAGWRIDPGYTPQQFAYPLDRIGERIDLRLAEPGHERIVMALEFAREKLLETKLMVAANEAGFAWVSAGLHSDYLKRAGKALEDVAPAEQGRRRLQLADELLEQIQVAAHDYADQYLDVREFALKALVQDTLKRFNQHYANLSESDRNKLSVKRERVRQLILTMHNLDGLREGPRAPSSE